MTFCRILGGLGKTLKWGVITLTPINSIDEGLSPEVEAILVACSDTILYH